MEFCRSLSLERYLFLLHNDKEEKWHFICTPRKITVDGWVGTILHIFLEQKWVCMFKKKKTKHNKATHSSFYNRRWVHPNVPYIYVFWFCQFVSFTVNFHRAEAFLSFFIVGRYIKKIKILFLLSTKRSMKMKTKTLSVYPYRETHSNSSYRKGCSAAGTLKILLVWILIFLRRSA